ncbi:MAG: hypothetical protein C5S44_09540 [Candidatus Methanocomedens sp.]|nr:MAG: hypothetical protein C5S44_09540 [ANME-2 cluster archaeon]
MYKHRYDNEEHEVYIREHEDIKPDEDYEMGLRVSDMKILWGKAGGKCSKCKCVLFKKEESDTNIGKECHISSHKPNHPSKEFSRYDSSLTEYERDRSYYNAILLCGNCHDIIDNPRNIQYTIEKLHQIKERHEADVEKNPEVIKERDERRKQLQEWIYDHNRTLMNIFIKPWSESKSVDEPNLLAIEHLETGYADIWNLRPDKAIFNSILEDRKAIKEILNKEFGGLPDSFERRRTSDIEKIRVYNLLEDFFQKDELPEDSTIRDSDEFVEAMLNHMVLYDKIKSLNKNEEIRDEKCFEFEQGLMDIVFGIEEQHKEFKGTCKICKDLHDQLESLK